MTDQEKLIEMFARVGKPLKLAPLPSRGTGEVHSLYQFEDDLQQACVYFSFDVNGVLLAAEIWE
jgi:hypothetical protein